MELLDYTVVLFLIVWGTSIPFFIVTAPSFYSYQQCTRVPFYLHSFQHLLLLVFLIIDVLTSVRWYLMVLICISLVINNVKHLFMYLLTVCVSSLEKCLFKSSAHFKIRFFKTELYKFFMYFGHWLLSHDLQIFSPVQYVAFSFCW